MKRLIWKEVFKEDAPSPFTQVHQDDLKTTLDMRYQDGENYYIVIAAQQVAQIQHEQSLVNQLRHDLQYLGGFLIGTDSDEQVLVVADGRLRARIRQFLIMLM